MIKQTIWAGFSLFVYIGIAVWDPNIKSGGLGSRYLGLATPHICACPKPGPGFPKSYYVVFFLFNELRREVIVRFVDIPSLIKCFINVRENRTGNQEWTIQTNWQHWAHKTQNEDNKKNKKKHKTRCVGHPYTKTNTKRHENSYKELCVKTNRTSSLWRKP